MTARSDTREPDRLLTPGETFSLLSVADSSGWALLAQDRIPRPIKIGRRTRWSRRALEEWIADQHKAAQAKQVAHSEKRRDK